MTPLASAYVAAGYRDTPWARYNASKLAHVPEVAARINELQTEFSDRSGIHAEYIQRKLLPLIESDPRKLFETMDDGSGNKFERLKTAAKSEGSDDTSRLSTSLDTLNRQSLSRIISHCSIATL